MKSLVNREKSAARRGGLSAQRGTADLVLPPMPVVWGGASASGIARDDSSEPVALQACGVSGLEQLAVENQWHPEDLDWEIRRHAALDASSLARMLSPVLHVKQAGLLGASAVVLGAHDMQVKRFAASQSFDLARHVEVLQRYMGGEASVLGMPPTLKALLEAALSRQAVPYLLAGMNMVVLGTSYGAMRSLNRQTGDALLKTITHHVLRDDARHVSFARHYLGPLIRCMSVADREALAGFVFGLLADLQRAEAQCAAPGCAVNFLSIQHAMIPTLIRTGLITSTTQQQLQALDICVQVDIKVRESLAEADEAVENA